MDNIHPSAIQALVEPPFRPGDLSVRVIFKTDDFDQLEPATPPRRTKVVCRCATLWGPAHGSLDIFRIGTHKNRTHWILWHGYFDDNEDMDWIYQPVATCKYPRVPDRAAAFYMLVELFRLHECFEQIANCIAGGAITENEVHLALAMAKGPSNQ